MTNLNELKSYLVAYLNEITTMTGNSLYICPICKSGTGKHRTGAFSIVPNSNGTAWRCHACGRSGSIIDLCGYVSGVDPKSKEGQRIIIQRLEAKYMGGSLPSSPTLTSPSISASEKAYIVEDTKLCIEACKTTIGASDYLTKRGISLEVQKRFNIGYCDKWLHPKTKWKHRGNPHMGDWTTPRIIIPTSDCSYLARATTPEPPNSKYYVKAFKVGGVHVFNPSALRGYGYCFVFEGEIDALSCIELGFEACAIGSVSNVDLLFRTYADTIKQASTVLILALDNDEAGKTATLKAIDLCKRHGIAYSVPDVASLYGGLKDCNDALQSDRKRLQEALASARMEAQKREKPLSNALLTVEATPNVDWQSNLKLSQKGNVFPSLHNIKLILQNDPSYKKIAYNELTNMRTYDCQDWSDYHESLIKLQLEEQYNLCASVENVNHVCNLLEHENRYHPIREYLNALAWDGISRIESLFIDFLGAVDNIYTRKVAIVTLLGAVARVYVPGIKFDTCTVFVGKQGIGKSKFISKLAVRQEWFSDCVTTFDGKEFYEAIQGKWLIELGEGTAFQKSMKERTKQAIASQQDSYRKPYARNPVTLKRQCIFFGTTNNYDFLKDETGDRRYYPIDVDKRRASKSIDTEFTPDYIAQVWAEAVSLYRKSTPTDLYITDSQVLSIAEQEQRNHFDESPLQSDIYNFLDILLPPPQEWYGMTLDSRRRYITAVQNGDDTFHTLGRTGVYKRDHISVKEIMCELYGYEINQPIERKISLDISRSLTALGWCKTGKSIRIQPYGKVKIYSAI